MRLPPGAWVELDEVDSTQRIAAEALLTGNEVGAVFAHDQTLGRGRFGRPWHSSLGESATFSLVFSNYADHPKPYLIGMACALAAAGVLHLHVRWPNDLVMGGRKVGGILTELLPDGQDRRVPVVGIGINLNQREFASELEGVATSVAIERGVESSPVEVAQRIVARLELIPEPNAWIDLKPVWDLFDQTPGKQYQLPSGEIALAIEVGSDAQLVCSVDGEPRSVMAADAIFGAGEP